MWQIFPHGTFGAIDSVGNTAVPVFSHCDGNDVFNSFYDEGFVAPCAGTLSQLKVRLDAAMTGDGNDNLDVEIGNLSVTIGEGETYGEDLLNSQSVAAGDRVTASFGESFLNQPDNGLRWSVRFTPNTSNRAIISAMRPVASTTSGSGPTTTRTYENLFARCGWSTDEAQRKIPVPLNATIRSFYFYFDQTVNNTTITLSLFKNGVEEASTLITFNLNDSGVKSVTGLNIPLVVGDTLSLSGIASGNSTEFGAYGWAIEYEPEIEGESIIGGMTENNLTTTQNLVQYSRLNGGNAVDTAESDFQQYIGEDCTLRNFSVLLNTAPGTSQSRIFRIRKNGANGNKSVTITGSSTYGIDNTNLETFAEGDLLSISTQPTTAGVTGAMATWTAVLFIDPTGSGGEEGGEEGGSGGISGQTLPTYNTSVVTALKNVQQGAVFPKFVLGGLGGSGGTTYALFKQGTLYNNHLWRSPVYSIGRRFRVCRISLRLGADLIDGMAVTPRLYFDNGDRSQNGMEIILNNYPGGVRNVVLSEDSFENNTEGFNNFFLELQWTSAVFLPIILPINVEVEVYDNPND